MDTKQKRGLKTLIVDVPKEIHDQLKYIGIMRNCTMRKLVLRALIAFIKYDERSN